MASLTRALTNSSRPQLLNLLLRSTTRSISTMTTNSLATESDENFSFLSFTADNEAMKHTFVMEGPKYPCSVKCEESAAYARVDLPGVNKEGVKVWVKDECLLVEAKEEKNKESQGFEKDEKARKYGVAIDLSEVSYEKEKIKAVMENGVLKVVIPLIKPEDEEGAFKIKVK